MQSKLDAFFKLSENNTTVRIELVAGATTFLTMAYIIFVNPSILEAAGMDRGAVFTATCLAAALGTMIMGLYANYPVALAPGMGLNAYFTYSVVLGMGNSWQTALGAVFVSGVLFMMLSVLPVRQWIINAIPLSQKMAISAGIGLFLAFIALKNAGIVIDHPATLVTLGDLTAPEAILAAVGFIAMVSLSARKVPGAMIIAIIGITFIGVGLGVTKTHGFISAPPSLSPTFMQMDIAGALELSMLSVILAFLLVDIFDTAGTLVAVAHRAKMLDANGHLPRIKKVLLADSAATVAGAAFGTSPTTSYIESASGVNAGGRTGLTAVVVACLFLLSLFLSPLAATIPAYATAPALLYVACLMIQGLAEIDWQDITEAAPAVVTAVAMPLTFSISSGIGLGLISFVAIKLASGRYKEISPIILILALVFTFKFAML